MTTKVVGKHHPKVEAHKAERQKKIDALYYGDKQPKYAPELMRQYEAEINAQFEAALTTLQEIAQLQHDNAEMTLGENQNPYEWLIGDELSKAATMAPFIREDLAAMDAAGLVAAVKAANNVGRVEKWLTWRYAQRRADELDQQQETALGMAQRAHFVKDLPALRDSIMPPGAVKERDKAKAEMRDAEELHDAAEWARPAVRQAAADRWGVNAEYLPD